MIWAVGQKNPSLYLVLEKVLSFTVPNTLDNDQKKDILFGLSFIHQRIIKTGFNRRKMLQMSFGTKYLGQNGFGNKARTLL